MARALAATLVLIALGVAGVWWLRQGSSTPVEVPTSLGEWRLVSGQLGPDGSVVDGDAVLAAGDSELRVAAGSRLGAPDGSALPRLLAGSAELRAPDAVVVLEPGSVLLRSGRFELGGIPLPLGTPLPLDARGIPLPMVSPAADDDDRPGSDVAAGTRGRVISARDGTPIVGAAVTATFSHFDDGYPPLPGSLRYRVVTDADGRFHFPPWNESDPRERVHLEVTHPEFRPEVLVVASPVDAEGVRDFVTVELRRALTWAYRVLDPEGYPLAGVAVSLPPRGGGDRFLGEDLWEEGRTTRADRALIRYADDDGQVLLDFLAPDPVLLHATLHVWHPIEARPSPTLVSGTLVPPEPGEVRDVVTRESPLRSYRLQELAGLPIAGEPIEIEVEGMAPVRLVTGEDGEFVFGPRPFDPTEPRLDFDNPRAGELRILSPRLFQHRRPVAFPTPETTFIIEGRLGSAITFELTELIDDGTGAVAVPVPANGVEIDRDLTLTERTRAGRVVYQGPVPPGGTRLDLRVRGFLPALLVIPATPPGTRTVDLGAIALARGETLAVRLTDGDPELHERTVLRIESPQDPELDQRYRFGADGELAVSGLVVRRRYRYALEGSRVRPVTGEFIAFEKLLGEGLAISVAPSDEVETRLRGRVELTDPEHARRYRVVERYFPLGVESSDTAAADDDEIIACRSYPLAPDGVFGSVRVLPVTSRAEVFIQGFDFGGPRAAYRELDPRQGLPLYDAGLVELYAARTATFAFFVPGLGPVGPPPGLSVYAERRRFHELVAFSWDDAGRLVLIFLQPGRHVLRWEGGDVLSDAHVFHVATAAGELQEWVERRAFAEELVEVSIVDGAGAPVADARVRTEVPAGEIIVPEVPATPGVFRRPEGIPVEAPEEWRPELPPGRYQVALYSGHQNHVNVEAPGLLPARVTLPAGIGFEEPVALVRGARVIGTVRDLEGYPFVGDLEVSWTPVPFESADGLEVEHGAPFVVPVSAGQLEAVGLPPGTRSFTFRQVSAEAKAERRLSIDAGERVDVGVLDLREGRSLRGIVELPGGRPAADAVVALLRPDAVFRYPQREDPLRQARASTRTDELGHYVLDGLPLDLREELALVAHLDGWTDAILFPVDLGLLDHTLFIDHPTELLLDIGVGDPEALRDHEFRLAVFDPLVDDWRDLGPLAVPHPDERLYIGISPGSYRATYGPTVPHPDVPLRVAEAEVWPARRSRLSLLVQDALVEGTARLNGERVASGWVVATRDPADPGAARVGRVTEGRFRVALDRGPGVLHAAVIPERSPIPRFEVLTGEALPLPVATEVGRSLVVDYEAYDLTIVFAPELIAEHPDLEIEFPHYAFSGGSYRSRPQRQPVGDAIIRLSLLQPGTFTFRVIAPGGWSRTRVLEIDEDLTYHFQR